MATIFGFDLDLIWESLIAIACLVIFLGVGAGVSLLLVTNRAMKIELKKRDEENEGLVELCDEELKKIKGRLEEEEQKNEDMGIDLSNEKAKVVKLTRRLARQTGELEDDVRIPTPFNICILGETTKKEIITSSLRLFFLKYGLKSTEWRVEFVDNSKLHNTSVLRKLKKGGNIKLVVTGQVYRHTGRNNSNNNLLTELNKAKYVDHIVGCPPQTALTVERLLDKLEDYIEKSFTKEKRLNARSG